jgi:hypothetical protein
MAIDLGTSLGALTDLMIDTVQSDDTRRFTIVHDVSRTAQQLIRSMSVRAEDFEDPQRVRASFKIPKYFDPHREQALVPHDLNGLHARVLEGLTHLIVATLRSEQQTRFAEVERITETARQFLVAVAPLKEPKRKNSDEDGDELICENPEAGYIRQAQAQRMAEDIDLPGRFEGPPDVNELRREIIEIESSSSQIAAELARAQIADAEASELEHLLGICTKGGTEVADLASARITQLKARLEFRTKGRTTNEVVSTDISRGHQPRRTATGGNAPQGHPRHAERTESPRNIAHEGALEALGEFAMGNT